MKAEQLCNTLFPQDRSTFEFKDETGCILHAHHEGPHECKTTKGQTVTWEYDFCGCEDCRTDDITDMCITYQIK